VNEEFLIWVVNISACPLVEMGHWGGGGERAISVALPNQRYCFHSICSANPCTVLRLSVIAALEVVLPVRRCHVVKQCSFLGSWEQRVLS
jgi:hypothetical protein